MNCCTPSAGWRLAISTALLLLLLNSSAIAAAGPERSTLAIGKKQVPYYANRPMDVSDPAITRAIIVIHGSGRKVAEYFQSIMDTMPPGTGTDQDWQRRALVVAPYFQEKEDARKKEYWWKGDWSAGGDSGGLSSYKVVDTLVVRLRSTFPNLKWVIITGHSAGGQFVQRYAAFTDIDQLPFPNAAFVKFVPSNPSSFVYLNPYRFSESAQDWVVPRGKKDKGYDEYKYGLADLEDYAKDRGPGWARTHLPRRWVELLVGTADIEADSSFDDTREAMWQGDSRLERAMRFDAFMDRFFAPNRFTLTPVPNVGHDHAAIYESVQARRALYFRD